LFGGKTVSDSRTVAKIGRRNNPRGIGVGGFGGPDLLGESIARFRGEGKGKEGDGGEGKQVTGSGDKIRKTKTEVFEPVEKLVKRWSRPFFAGSQRRAAGAGGGSLSFWGSVRIRYVLTGVP